MTSLFEVSFPLVLEYHGSIAITFTLEKNSMLTFKKGIYYLHGDNGSGKTSFLNMLALIAGSIGKKGRKNGDGIKFKGRSYNGKDFNHIKAAEIREKYFCIFPQKVFFLPVSTRDNYLVLNGSERKKAGSFSSREYPDLLSGGQQQKILMDIVLDEKKPVWFLDEPLANLDAERRYYFWKILENAYKKKLSAVFYIDHWIGAEIENDKNFRHCNTLRVFLENRQKGESSDIGIRHIKIFENNSPEEFFRKQIHKIEREKAFKI